jgi:hypothetical protein
MCIDLDSIPVKNIKNSFRGSRTGPKYFKVLRALPNIESSNKDTVEYLEKR